MCQNLHRQVLCGLCSLLWDRQIYRFWKCFDHAVWRCWPQVLRKQYYQMCYYFSLWHLSEDQGQMLELYQFQLPWCRRYLSPGRKLLQLSWREAYLRRYCFFCWPSARLTNGLAHCGRRYSSMCLWHVSFYCSRQRSDRGDWAHRFRTHVTLDF